MLGANKIVWLKNKIWPAVYASFDLTIGPLSEVPEQLHYPVRMVGQSNQTIDMISMISRLWVTPDGYLQLRSKRGRIVDSYPVVPGATYEVRLSCSLRTGRMRLRIGGSRFSL
jgi:hypothetical protein